MDDYLIYVRNLAVEKRKPEKIRLSFRNYLSCLQNFDAHSGIYSAKVCRVKSSKDLALLSIRVNKMKSMTT